ncbi:propanediol utilization phosphotransacylase [Thermosipho africanus H17ap60334]|jgi:putative phosphotransacetylase|uniref:Phosphate propanoyltransferase n=2 Tax=Thermosipho TaxID=2420 RepID=A0A841GH04_9BACT|nr:MULTISPECIES: phosphate propanoyltransferase [Thermosipho]ACJ75415.1 propanediol utilization protein [Thermosipho africanus TCF52B]EKF50118.1 propanediol utilization phosphotransacylase [Thermosipho africanus H17ap60334]MBB6062892.1 putative phosphotransacetylase [Thermosipho japonicus]MBZ4650578.1 propanediol utilization protein [Thermosipho sp. (in: thermotogales)]MDK2839391.1 putative phosphotransacetylase [Thermosipho sp. (in: thermotogales)]
MKIKEPGIIAGVSNRHVHLSREDVEILFGKDYQLTPIKDLGQPGQFACQETVIIVGPKGAIEKVRVLGPERKETQIEISLTDAFKIGVRPPVRDSGDLDGTPGIVIVGPKGSVIKDKGVIIAKRHIHMHTSDAEKYGVKDKDIVKVLVEKEGRRLIFDDVLIRVSEKYALEFHVDTDEANAALLKTGDLVYIIDEE